jgi:hypothetical protein
MYDVMTVTANVMQSAQSTHTVKLLTMHDIKPFTATNP